MSGFLNLEAVRRFASGEFGDGIRTAFRGFPEWARSISRRILDHPRWPYVSLLMLALVAGGCAHFSLCTNDGYRISNALGISRPILAVCAFGSCTVFLGLTLACQWAIGRLNAAWRETWAEFFTTVATTLFSGAYLYTSTFLGTCIVEDTKSLNSVMVVSWGLILSVLMSGVAEDFGLTDCFVAANFGIAIKLPVPFSICPRLSSPAPTPAPARAPFAPSSVPVPARTAAFAIARPRSFGTPSLLPALPSPVAASSPKAALARLVVKRVAIAFGPVAAKIFIPKIVEMWTKWAEIETKQTVSTEDGSQALPAATCEFLPLSSLYGIIIFRILIVGMFLQSRKEDERNNFCGKVT